MRKFIICVIVISLAGTTAFASSQGRLYSKAVHFAKREQRDFAYMQYNQLLRDFPKTKFREQALFATGEYYYRELNLKQAKKAFEAFLEEFPESEGRIYGLAYMLGLAVEGGDETLIEDLEKKIIHQQQVSLVFRDKKEVAYLSPLHQEYKTVIHIDKIEFFVEGELFAKVSY